MTLSYINRILILFTALIWGVILLWPDTLNLSLEIFFLMVFLFGIPHGALDHLMHFKNKRASTKKLIIFYSRYIALIAVVALVWYLLPKFMFILFLLISAHHFGQSQLFKFDIPNILKHIFYLAWGVLLLGTVIFFNYEESLGIFKSIEWLNAESWVTPELWAFSTIGGLIVMILISLYLIIKGQKPSDLLEEWLILGVLILLSIQGNAVFTFALYFGLWHSFRSLLIEYKELQSVFDSFSLKSFVIKLIPYSLLALFFLFASYEFLTNYSVGISPYMFFIIFISTLTVPHLFVMSSIYESFNDS